MFILKFLLRAIRAVRKFVVRAARWYWWAVTTRFTEQEKNENEGFYSGDLSQDNFCAAKREH